VEGEHRPNCHQGGPGNGNTRVYQKPRRGALKIQKKRPGEKNKSAARISQQKLKKNKRSKKERQSGGDLSLSLYKKRKQKPKTNGEEIAKKIVLL